MTNKAKSKDEPKEPGAEMEPVPKQTHSRTPTMVPVLPVKNMVLYPGMMMPLAIGRPLSAAAVYSAAGTEEKHLVVVCQRDVSIDEPAAEDLYSTGTLAVLRRMNQGEQALELLVSGTDRVALEDIKLRSGCLRAHVKIVPQPADSGTEVEAMRQTIMELGQKALSLAQPHSPVNIQHLVRENPDPLWLCYLLGSSLGLETKKQQSLLEVPTRIEALRLLLGYLTHEIQVLELRQKIAQKAQGEMSREQRNYYLRQQLRAIQEELGEKSPENAEAETLRQRLKESDLPEEVQIEAERQLKQLERTPPAAPDFQLTRSYLELILELPWKKTTQDSIDLVHARQVLDEDHHGLNDVKERILEHLSIMKLNPHAHAPILCFVGPPGVGKTSLGQSIARALGRKFERISLGGLHDEAELRGHRRTYIGAMPGRIIQAVRRAGVKNPVLMLDEIDKLGRDYRGDPAAALMEILDPAQNSTFHDNYLDVSFDLSRTLFITTANTLDTIPQPLLDRMELLRLSGYTQEEKLVIARRYLLPRQLSVAALKPEQLQVPDETMMPIIARYTREAGVRELERALARIIRKLARQFADGKTDTVIVRPDDLNTLLGPERFFLERARKLLPAGIATGLAWTEAGGDVLYIETSLLPDGKGLRLTGSLGNVMKESARAAQSYIWSHADELGIDRTVFRKSGVHIHVPAGAVPKDGPSAGVALTAALASLYRNTPVASDLAMTGEITLSGLVLPVGGIKEKVLAARRSGIRKVIIPKDNAKDLRELSDSIRQEMTFFLAETIGDVLKIALPIMPSTVGVGH